jgi:hypothetical protein
MIDDIDLESYDQFSFPDTDADKEKYINSIFGVVDLDHDGDKEVYSIARSGGSGTYSFDIKLYDTLTRQAYVLEGMASYEDHAPQITLSQNISKTPIREWLLAKAHNLNMGKDEDGDELSKAVQYWVRDNGSGFYKGKLTVRQFKGQPHMDAASVVCTVEDN